MAKDLLVFMTWKTMGNEKSLDEKQGTWLLDLLPVLARRIRCHLVEIAVLTNHVHVVASLPQPMPMSQLAQRLKGASSRLLNLQRTKKMKWAHGYHVKTISREALPIVRNYLDSQAEKHRLPWVKRWGHCMQVPVTSQNELVEEPDDSGKLAVYGLV